MGSNLYRLSQIVFIVRNTSFVIQKNWRDKLNSTDNDKPVRIYLYLSKYKDIFQE